MAASSSSASGQRAKGTYDVFLSFRGEDTRKTFVSHLYAALKEKGIHTFRDDERLDRGKSIASELPKAIDDSKIAIVVFSKNYANSPWCLDELVRIVESQPNKIVIPVFYDVDPSDVRHQQNDVAQALFRALVKRGPESSLKVQTWKKALEKAAGFSGFDVRNTANGDESECIKLIVASVFRKLRSTIPNDRKDVVGMEWREGKVLEMLRVEESETIRMVGIWGMGGAGKTTTANAIFHNLSHSYDASCFLQIDAGERWDDEYLKHLQKKLLSKILKSDDTDISYIGDGINMIKDKLQCKKVLIVLDNVGHDEQLTALAVDQRDSFGNGSRVIITTRDNHLLLHRVDEQYKMELLNEDEGLQLFCWHAFGRSHPPNEKFDKLSGRAVKRAGGLPLALKVLGSHLQGFRNLKDWSSELTKLKKVPHNKIHSILRISYDGLDDVQKRLFLDIACFFKGYGKREVMRTLDSLELHPQSGITALVAKSLVSIEFDEICKLDTLNMHTLNMHDLIQEMGRNIVRKDHPGSRLWEDEEVIDVLNGRQECDTVESIKSYVSLSNIEGLKRMKRLKLLWLFGGENYSDGAPEYLSDELRWFQWDLYPWDSLPASFQGKKLVGLVMRDSSMVQPITGKQRFHKLRIMDLSWSPKIIQTPDFSKFPCLEELGMRWCENLVEVHSSFGVHRKLQFVDLSGCKNLIKLPEGLQMESLKRLNLKHCQQLEKFPEIKGNNIMTALEVLDLSYTGIRRLPSSMKNLTGLRTLNLDFCQNFNPVSLHSVEVELENQGELLTVPGGGCSSYLQNSLKQFFLDHHIMHDEDTLKDLAITLCFPPATDHANNYNSNNISPPPSSIIAIIRQPNDTRILTSFPSFLLLTYLNLNNCLLAHLTIPENCLPSLQKLNVNNNDKLEELVISTECLSSLRHIDLRELSQYRGYRCCRRKRREKEHRLQDLFNQWQQHSNGRNLSGLVSLLKTVDYKEDEVYQYNYTWFDWESLFGALSKRNSKLTIRISTNYSLDWFEFQNAHYGHGPYEVILPPIPSWYNPKFRGLAISAFISEGIINGFIDVKYSYEKLPTHNHCEIIKDERHILFQYIPISGECFQCHLTDSQTAEPPEKIDLLEISIREDKGEDVLPDLSYMKWRIPALPYVKWGIRLVYDEDEAEQINYVDIQVKRVQGPREPSEVGYLKVSSCTYGATFQ